MFHSTILSGLENFGIKVNRNASVVYFDFLGLEGKVVPGVGGIEFTTISNGRINVVKLLNNEFQKSMNEFAAQAMKESGLLRYKTYQQVDTNITTALAKTERTGVTEWTTFQIDPLFFDNLFLARVTFTITHVEIEWNEKLNIFVRGNAPKTNKIYLKSLKRGSYFTNDEILFLIKNL